MNIFNIKKACNLKVESWLLQNIPELTIYQKQKIIEDELIRFAPFYFYESRETKPVGILTRLTMPFFVLVWVVLLLFLPIKFLFTGTWYYDHKFFNFIGKWYDKLSSGD